MNGKKAGRAVSDDEAPFSSGKAVSPEAYETVGIVGLGLIGGSLAKAVKGKTKSRVLGYDLDDAVTGIAVCEGVLDGRLAVAASGGKIPKPPDGVKRVPLDECELVIVALYPDDVVNWCRDNFGLMKPGTVIVDCAGVKTKVCAELTPLAEKYGLRFIGGHPMAGIERSGFDNSFAGLFEKAPMILCEEDERLYGFFLSLGFARIKETTPEEHDRVIAYTSQLAHLVSSAYIHGETRKRRHGFSAGSFKDLTRVARLNAAMWTSLFMENRENLLKETDAFIEKVLQYRDALAGYNYGALEELLRTGNDIKIFDETEGSRWQSP